MEEAYGGGGGARAPFMAGTKAHCFMARLGLQMSDRDEENFCVRMKEGEEKLEVTFSLFEGPSGVSIEEQFFVESRSPKPGFGKYRPVSTVVLLPLCADLCRFLPTCADFGNFCRISVLGVDSSNHPKN